MSSFNAVVVDKTEAGYAASVKSCPLEMLTEGDVLIRVDYSTINYKDGLALTTGSPIIRSFPLIPGIDFAGTVVESGHKGWRPGDRVILNGWGVGETHHGGLAQMARVSGDWLIACPGALSTRQAMAIGTAGYTAMLCILALEQHGMKPDQGEVLVTGAAGGVGSIAIAVLSKLGFRVVASTGRLEETSYLKALGAAEVIDRRSLSEPGKPLAKERWAATVDSVGSYTLANACAATKSQGAVAACGLAQGMDFPATVAPFILRGITLYGINSVTMPVARRQLAWARLATDLDQDLLDMMTEETSLNDCLRLAQQIVAGRVRGRIVVDVNRF
jgi:acrylyl-CoA reductase (NADPH)